MNFNHRPRKILITGKSGSGKTTLWLVMLKHWRSRWKFVFDPDREAARKLGYSVCTRLEHLNAAFTARKIFICYDPHEMFPGDWPGGFAWFCRWTLNVSRLFRGPKVLAVDEIQKWTATGPGGVPQSFQELLDVGRREEIDLLLVAQRPNRVNDAIRGQLTEIITFQHTDVLPLKWLAEDFNSEDVKALTFPGGHLSTTFKTDAHPARKGSLPTPAKSGKA